jgi:hypothetical protein
MTSVAIRGVVAEGADGERIDRLAALADSRPPEGAILVAEEDGELVAAIGVFDGHAISDPARSSLGLRLRLHLLRLGVRLVVAISGL